MDMVKVVRKTRAGVSLLILAAAAMPAAVSKAAVMHDASYNTGVYEALGDQYQGSAMWLNAIRGGVEVGGFSAVRLNDWYGLTAAHPLWTGSDVATSAWGGFGDNWVSNPGFEVGIDEIHYHPTWNGNLTQVLANGWADLAVIKFDQPVPGPDLEIGSLALGEMFTTVGNGRPGTPGLGWLPDDNARRGFHQYVDQFGFAPSIATNYVRSKLEPLSFRNDLLGAGGGPGNSGSGGFSSDGELIALAVATALAPNYGMSTYNLRLDLYEPWVSSIVPEPSSLSLLLFGIFVAKRRRN